MRTTHPTYTPPIPVSLWGEIRSEDFNSLNVSVLGGAAARGIISEYITKLHTKSLHGRSMGRFVQALLFMAVPCPHGFTTN